MVWCFFVLRYYWLVALFIFISLSEHELQDKGVFCDKNIKEVLTYLNASTTGEIVVSQRSEQSIPLLESQSALAMDDMLLSEKIEECNPALETEHKNTRTQELHATVKKVEQTEEPTVLPGKIHILLKVVVFH